MGIITKPYTFASGNVTDGTKVNANFDALIAGVGDVATLRPTVASLGLDADLTTLVLPANTTISAAGAELINDANATAQLATLGAVAMGDSRLSDARVASDVSAWAKAGTKPTYASSEITNISAAGQALIDDADAAAQRATLGGVPLYSEADWTPSLQFGGASVGITYALQTAHYIRIGNMVTVKGRIALSSKGTSTGDAVITNLPFTASSIDSHCPISLLVAAVTYAGQIEGEVVDGTTTIKLYCLTEAGTIVSLKDTNFGASDVHFSATYMV